VRLEGLGKLKSPVTSSRLEPVAFQLVAQRLNIFQSSSNLGTMRTHSRPYDYTCNVSAAAADQLNRRIAGCKRFASTWDFEFFLMGGNI
jgi:hypothetical protein